MQTDRTNERPGFLARHLIVTIGVMAYLGFHAVFLLMISFLNGGPVPWASSTAPSPPVSIAVAINLGLVALFGLQHAVMARPWFKRALTQWIPESLERSTFVITTCLCLGAAMYFWQSVPGTLFEVEGQALRLTLFAVQAIGWGVVVLSTFLLDHFELFGLRQIFCAYRGQVLPVQRFRTPMLYRFSRHPMMVGMMVAFWSTPDMTFDRLLWAAGFSLYILAGVRIEERDLVAHLGADYAAYQKRVPRLVGWTRGRGAAPQGTARLVA